MLDANDETVWISFCGSGPGVPPEALPHLFERFYRTDTARQYRSGSGAGLGLAIVKWVAEAHGGRVTVDSSVGQGSTFSLIRPRHEAVPVEAALPGHFATSC